MCVLSRYSHVQLFATLWKVACQALPSQGYRTNPDLCSAVLPHSRTLLELPGEKKRVLAALTLSGWSRQPLSEMLGEFGG